MQKIIIYSVFLLMFSLKGLAQEVDQFTRRKDIPKDSLTALDEEINFRIASALINTKGYFLCNSKDENERRSSREVLFKNLVDQLTKSSLEKYATKNKAIDKRNIFLDESVYSANLKISDLALVVNVGGIQIGLDKLSQFFNESYRPYARLRSENPNFADKKNTQVRSYADRAATLDGFKFWKKLCSSPRAGLSSTVCDNDAILTCSSSGIWTLNPKVKFTLKDYVTPAWDESINCSLYETKYTKAIVDKMLREVRNYKKDPINPCPVESEKCSEVFEKYYGENPEVVSPICRKVVKIKKQTKKYNGTEKFDYTIDQNSNFSDDKAVENKDGPKRKQ